MVDEAVDEDMLGTIKWKIKERAAKAWREQNPQKKIYVTQDRHLPNAMPSSTHLFLLVVFAFCLSHNGVYAFGAGNIPSSVPSITSLSSLTVLQFLLHRGKGLSAR